MLAAKGIGLRHSCLHQEKLLSRDRDAGGCFPEAGWISQGVFPRRVACFSLRNRSDGLLAMRPLS